MILVAEVLNSDDSVVRYLQVPDDFVAPAQKYGPSFATRVIPVVDVNPEPFDQSIFVAVPHTDVLPDSIQRTVTLEKRPDDQILAAVDAETVQRIGGFSGILLLVRSIRGDALTDAENEQIGYLNSVLDTAAAAKADPASIDSVSKVAWPSKPGGIVIQPSPPVPIKT